jgi:hypothetical protein
MQESFLRTPDQTYKEIHNCLDYVKAIANRKQKHTHIHTEKTAY